MGEDHERQRATLEWLKVDQGSERSLSHSASPSSFSVAMSELGAFAFRALCAHPRAGAPGTIADFSLPELNVPGGALELKELAGQVLLIVNVASF